MRILCKNIASQIGKDIEMMGWIHRIRELGGVSFVVLRDRSGTVQLVYQGKVEYTLETVVRVSGIVAANEKAPGGAELQVSKTVVLGAADGELPFPVNQDPEKTSLEVILDNRHLSLRNPKLRGIFTIQSAICQYFSEYLRGQDFTEVKTTKLTSTGAEGGTGLFEVDYFEHKLYLAQSPQLYKQTMVASGLERVFEIADAYRAEKHDTPRHLNEYVSMDVEMAFIESEAELMELERNILKYVFTNIQENHADILAELIL